jgi:hypothetical protein
LERPVVPPVATAGWTQGAIDNFILARLEESKIKPAPTADRRTLLRRLALDLTGLPPTPEDVERFVNDPATDAYARQVERLLASPHFGERMAVPWLDAVRFADTVGYHGDQDQNIFPYRDYVIEAFNRNQPFDQFTLEQIAGDLLPNPTVAQQIATGFNRLNMITREGGAQPKEYLAKYSADRVRTVSTTWLGSTMACCECHDHKYDPFSTKDFYSLAAFFADIKQWGVYQTYKYTPNPELAGWSNDHPFPPELTVTNAHLLAHEAKLRQAVSETIATATAELLATARPDFETWKRNIRANLKPSPDGWDIARQPQVEITGKGSQSTVTVQTNGLIVVTGPTLTREKFQLTLAPPAGWLTAIRLELVPTATNHFSSLRTTGKNATIKLMAELTTAAGPSTPLKFRASAATSREPMYSNGHEILAAHPIWTISTQAGKNPQTAVYVLDTPLLLAPGAKLKLNLSGTAPDIEEPVGCALASFRLATTALAAAEPLQAGANAGLRQALGGLGSRAKTETLVATWIRSTTNQPAVAMRLKQLDNDILQCNHGVAQTLVTVATTNRLVTRVLPRGDWQNETGELVAPAVPHFLPQPVQNGTNRLTRLDLARWLVSPENPLTARAFVNRLWKQLFGNGLSNQPEELGTQGEFPTHPELLDWLAMEFRQPTVVLSTTLNPQPTHAWDVKHLVRLLVLSATYQQDAKIRPELRDVDPNNRLLARQNPRRLEAEFVRDNALAIAGLLNPEIGGPSVKPYQPAGYYSNLQFPNRDYHPSMDANQYRRGLYSHWQRSFLHPMLANFDAPAREECSVDRPTSSTPQQALTLLNDPSLVEAARGLAEKILTAPKIKNDAARLNFAIETALLRPAKPPELESLQTFLGEQRDYFNAHPGDAKKLLQVGQRPPAEGLNPAEAAAWTSLARVVLNLHETITRY